MMLLSPTEFPTDPALREVARALLYVAAPPPLTTTIEVDVNGGRVTQVRVPERALTADQALMPRMAPLTPEQWTIIQGLEQRLGQHRAGRHVGRWLIAIVGGVPQLPLHWKPAFVVSYD